VLHQVVVTASVPVTPNTIASSREFYCIINHFIDPTWLSKQRVLAPGEMTLLTMRVQISRHIDKCRWSSQLSCRILEFFRNI